MTVADYAQLAVGCDSTECKIYCVICSSKKTFSGAYFFSLSPTVIHTGLNILFSGVASKLTMARELHSLLILSFVEALTPPTTLYPLPPNTTQYTGFYTAKWSNGKVALANIYLNKGSLALSGSAFRGIYLAYREPSRFQVGTQYYRDATTYLHIPGNMIKLKG